MNIFEFYNKLKENNNQNVMIVRYVEGSVVLHVCVGRGDLTSFFPNLDDLLESTLFKRHQSFPFYLVTLRGTDYSNAILDRIQ